jgi:hypothetical protein
MINVIAGRGLLRCSFSMFLSMAVLAASRMKCALPIVVVALLAAGCAGNKPLESGRIEKVALLEVARYATPEIQRHSAATILGGGLIFGGFGMEAVAASAGQQLRERCALEDFGRLVADQFVAQAPAQIPSWPKMRVQETPIEPGYVARDAHLLAFKPEVVWLYSFGPKGLMASVSATLVAPDGSELWRHLISYSQKDAGRMRELEELEANDCRLLKEEMRYAARVMAAQFVGELGRSVEAR